jgi:hypothetical protein
MGRALRELGYPRQEYVISTKIFFGTGRVQLTFASPSASAAATAGAGHCAAAPAGLPAKARLAHAGIDFLVLCFLQAAARPLPRASPESTLLRAPGVSRRVPQNFSTWFNVHCFSASSTIQILRVDQRSLTWLLAGSPSLRLVSGCPVLPAASLHRLGLDYVDLLYCHRPDPDCSIEETVRAMNWVGSCCACCAP